MLLFVGLGNPGREYANHRHNAGFMAVDALAARYGFGAWRARFRGQVAEGRMGADRVMLLKPATYMNRSGLALAEAIRFYKLAPEKITVFHDELDLDLGRVRVKAGGGHGGNNGLRSIIEHIGPDFRRVRIGIGHPGDKSRVTGHVLGVFARSEQALRDQVIEAVCRAAPKLTEGDAPGFLNAVALFCPPPKAAKSAKSAKAAKAAKQTLGETPSPGPEKITQTPEERS